MRGAATVGPPLIALLTAGLVGGCTSSGSSTSKHSSPSAGPTVTCRAESGGANRDRAVLQHRVRAIAKDGSVAITGNTVRLRVPGAKRAQATGLCRRGEVALRPLIAPTGRVSDGAHTDPLDNLGFAVPKDEPAFARLPIPDQQTLQRRLRAASCAAVPSDGRPVVACGRVGGPSDANRIVAALLAAPIIDASGVRSAVAVAPESSQGFREWTVDVVLSTPARAVWARYTTDHNTNRAQSVDSALCSTLAVPCASWVGVVADGKLLSLPVTNEPITQGRVRFSGGFTASSAAELSAALGAGALPAPLSLVSVG